MKPLEIKKQEIEKDFLHAISDPRFKCGMRLNDRKLDLDVKCYIAEIYKKYFLKEGEKYKKMWGELENIVRSGDIFTLLPNDMEKKGLHITAILKAFLSIEQKYFPKPKPKTICGEYKDKIISNAKRLEILGMEKFKDYYYYVGAIDTLLEMKKITREEHIELSNTIQKNLSKEDKIKRK